MKKFERKFLAHYLDSNPLGDPATAVTNETNYLRLGKDLTEYNEELNPDVSTEKNILGETTVVHNGFSPSSDVDPFYVRGDDQPEELAEKILDIANNRRTGAGTRTTKVDALVNISGEVISAYREDVVIVPKSVGGDTSGVKVPFSIYNDGNRVKGTFDPATKKFTPVNAVPQSSE